MAKNFYETLGVPKTASDKEIKAAYRRLARKHHPDVNPGDKASEARFKEVNAAHEVLSDPEKRKKYDRYGDRWEQADQFEDARRGQAPFNWARSGATGFEQGGGGPGTAGDFGSIFDNLFRRERGGPRGQSASRRGQDIETPVEVTLEEAFHGTLRTLNLQAPETCRTCGGSGEVGSAVCHTCEGTGQSVRARRLEVKVPAGVKTGSRVRVAGEGRGGVGGGPNGDLYLVVTVMPHARFERNGDNVTVEAPVPFTAAVLGGEVQLQTLDGRVALRIPELTQNGRQIRLAGKGMPVLGDPTRRGDLFVRVKVQLPESLTIEQRALYEQLRALETPAAATA